MELKGILETLRETGEITKKNLLKLWSQEKFHQHMPNGDFKEFIIQILVHLKDATHLFHQCEKLQLEDTNKYVLVFSVKAKHGLQHQLT
jgi:hypothetical protein